MPDFTVYEGGKDSEEQYQKAAQVELEQMVVALVRSLANGTLSPHVIDRFIEFVKIAGERQLALAPIFSKTMRELWERAFGHRVEDDIYLELRRITSAALGVIVEELATDALAAARAPKRRDELRRALDYRVVCEETRSLTHGRSYVRGLAEEAKRSVERTAKRKLIADTRQPSVNAKEHDAIPPAFRPVRVLNESDVALLKAVLPHRSEDWIRQLPTLGLLGRESDTLEQLRRRGVGAFTPLGELRNCGPDTAERLLVRGYAEIRRNKANAISKVAITPAGIQSLEPRPRRPRQRWVP